MKKTTLNALQSFLAVARNKSFTKAAAELGITPSALSHIIKDLEEQLGLRLLARTTRNVSPTKIGEQLITSVGFHLNQINLELEKLNELRGKPVVTIRITCTDDSIEMCLRPLLKDFFIQYPDIILELHINYEFINIIEHKFDAGIRLVNSIDKDMIAVRIGTNWRMAVVGSPDYFQQNSFPTTPYELIHHKCINIRHNNSGNIYAWEFRKHNEKFTVKVNGPLILNSSLQMLNSALDGIGLAFIPQPLAAPYLHNGQLQETLNDWCPVFQGFHLYYPNRRNMSLAFSNFIQAIRYRD